MYARGRNACVGEYDRIMMRRKKKIYTLRESLSLVLCRPLSSPLIIVAFSHYSVCARRQTPPPHASPAGSRHSFCVLPRLRLSRLEVLLHHIKSLALFAVILIEIIIIIIIIITIIIIINVKMHRRPPLYIVPKFC